MLDAGADLEERVIARHTVIETNGSHIVAEPKTPLCSAIEAKNVELALFFVERGAEVNARAADDCVPLIPAALNNEATVVSALVNRGADVRVQTSNGLTLWQLTDDPDLRHFFESKGLHPVVLRVDLTGPANDTQAWLEDVFRHNLSVEWVSTNLQGQIHGNPPYDVVLKFPNDSTRAVYRSVQVIRLWRETTGQPEKKDQWGSDKNITPNLKDARHTFWVDTGTSRLGFSLEFYYERAEAE